MTERLRPSLRDLLLFLGFLFVATACSNPSLAPATEVPIATHQLTTISVCIEKNGNQGCSDGDQFLQMELELIGPDKVRESIISTNPVTIDSAEYKGHNLTNIHELMNIAADLGYCQYTVISTNSFDAHTKVIQTKTSYVFSLCTKQVRNIPLTTKS